MGYTGPEPCPVVYSAAPQQSPWWPGHTLQRRMEEKKDMLTPRIWLLEVEAALRSLLIGLTGTMALVRERGGGRASGCWDAIDGESFLN